MSSPEQIKQTLIATLIGIILDPDNLRVVCGPCTHILIAWIMQQPLAITNFCLCYPQCPLEGQLNTPKAASTKLSKLLTWFWYVIIWPLSNCWINVFCCPWATQPNESAQQVHGGLVTSNIWMSFAEAATILDRKTWECWKELRVEKTGESRRK